jgi:hypothetical protein
MAGAGQAHPQPGPHQQDKEHLAGQRPGRPQPLGLLRLAGHARLGIRPTRQSTGPGQRRPGTQPVMQFLIRQAPQGAQQPKQQQGIVCENARDSARTRWQRRRTLTLGLANRGPTQLQQVQASHQRECIQMQRVRQTPVISWWGHCCLIRVLGRYHRMPPGRGSKPRCRSILPSAWPVMKRPRALTVVDNPYQRRP